LASRIGFEDNEMLRQALKKDYERVLARFVGVIKSPEAVEAALGLTGEDAEDFLDDLQSVSPRF
jgi:hypothetical protein